MKLYIYDALLEFQRKNPLKFHMPGHNYGAEFLKLFPSGFLDVTDLEQFDCLDNPYGIIKRAQDNIRNIFGSKAAFMLTDGSTSGVYAMVKATHKQGKKLIISRNSHKSVFNICSLLNIEPVIIPPVIKNGYILPPDAKQLEKILNEYSANDMMGALLTSPDYYGTACNLKAVKELLERKNLYLLVDNAHGAHIRFSDTANYSGVYADIWVDGMHKTAPALSQGAVLHVGNEKLIEQTAAAVKMFRTSSPNYEILASVEYAAKYLDENGVRLIKGLTERLCALKANLKMRGAEFLDNNDPLKLVLDLKSINVSENEAEAFLIGENINYELCDGRYMLFLVSVDTKAADISRLEKALAGLIKNVGSDGPGAPFSQDLSGALRLSRPTTPALSYIESVNSEKELLDINECEGRVCAENFGVSPPCVPVCVAGERINKEIIDYMKNKSGKFGFYADNKVWVIK